MDKKQQGIMGSILIAQNFHALALNFCLREERIKLNQIWYQNNQKNLNHQLKYKRIFRDIQDKDKTI